MEGDLFNNIRMCAGQAGILRRVLFPDPQPGQLDTCVNQHKDLAPSLLTLHVAPSSSPVDLPHPLCPIQQESPSKVSLARAHSAKSPGNGKTPFLGKLRESALQFDMTTVLANGTKAGIWSGPTISFRWPQTGPLTAQRPNSAHNRQKGPLHLTGLKETQLNYNSKVHTIHIISNP